jgi:hypothetical protein
MCKKRRLYVGQTQKKFVDEDEDDGVTSALLHQPICASLNLLIS